MLTAPALSTAVPASADDRETACRGQIAHLVEKGFRPMNGLLARGERPASVVAVTAISALLSRISGSTQLGFGDYLRDLRDDLAAMSGRSGGPKLTCAAADATLPIGAAIHPRAHRRPAHHRRVPLCVPARAGRRYRCVLRGRAGGLSAHCRGQRDRHASPW
jgi:hypothetical protein